MAKTVGQAFNIAYHEFLKANRLNLGEIEDMEYNGILEQQKILGEELSLLADESKTKEVCANICCELSSSVTSKLFFLEVQ